MEARRRAVEALSTIPAHGLVDGKRRIAGCRIAQTPVVDGDTLSASNAAASIVDKVTRDSQMRDYARLYPGYGLERQKVYGTTRHLDVLGRLGPLPLHRSSFKRCGWRSVRNDSSRFGMKRRQGSGLAARRSLEHSLPGRPRATLCVPESKHVDSGRCDPIINMIANACQVNAPDRLEVGADSSRSHVGLQ
jgi:hypothetical protein